MENSYIYEFNNRFYYGGDGMKYMVLLAASAVVVANVDMVDTDLGLCVSWIDASGAWVRNMDESVYVQFSDDYDHISLAEGIDPGGTQILVSLSDRDEEVPDSIFLLETQTMNVLRGGVVTPDSLITEPPIPPIEGNINQLSLNRYDRGMGRQLTAAAGSYTSTICDIWITVSLLSDNGTTLGIETTSAYHDQSACLSFPETTAPVNLLGGCFAVNRSYNYFTFEYHHWLTSLTCDLPVDDGMDTPLFSFTLYSENNTNPDKIRMIAAGSDLSNTVLLWGDCSLENVCTSIFIDDVQPSSTVAFPWNHPRSEPAAMSCHPYYDGALLAWVQGSDLMCRHFDGCWNDLQHVVRTGLGSVADGNIAVCSDLDGYWIAWLENAKAEPELAFVPRDSVTGINRSETPEGLSLFVGPNPFSGLLTAQVQGLTEDCPLYIYDSAGRMVGSGTLNAEGFSWDGASFPAGVYSIVAELPEGPVVRRVIRAGSE
jgi:hypothetical protein